MGTLHFLEAHKSFLFDNRDDVPHSPAALQVVYSDGAAGQAMFNKYFAQGELDLA